MANYTAIVVGAGIVGLAMARSLARKGFSVKVIERSHKPVGASIRNFGMVWPIGQPSGTLYERALRSRFIWKEQCREAGLWCRETGSLHVAHHADEWDVLQEVCEAFKNERSVKLLTRNDILALSDAVVDENLFGGLYSADELLVDPREAIPGLARYLEETEDVEFSWGKCVTYIADQTVFFGSDQEWEADVVFICSGADFETLYPEIFEKEAITKCKLQMMRFASQSPSWKLGPSLCGGLSLVHYKSFQVASSLPGLKARYSQEMSEYLNWGIHVMVAQNGRGELIVGDSHEYGNTFDPFNKSCLNEMILSYLKTFATLDEWKQLDSWNGVYAKLKDGRTEMICSPENGVYIVNGLGGAGMTLSFGLAEEIIASVA
jgi:FAD dependent oxidoreductase TIGR03364